MKRATRPQPGRKHPLQLERTLTYRLHKLHKLTDRQSQPAYIEGTGLSMSEGRCLAAIGAFAPLSVNDLAQRANLTKGQASRAAQSLVDQGLVRKETSKEDGRGVVLAPSRKGVSRWKRVMEVIEMRNDAICHCLSPAERDLVGRLLDRMIAHTKAGPSVDVQDD